MLEQRAQPAFLTFRARVAGGQPDPAQPRTAMLRRDVKCREMLCDTRLTVTSLSE